MKILIITFLIVFIVYFRKVKIKWKTFLRRGFYKSAKPYGVYCYCGKQGKGKAGMKRCSCIAMQYALDFDILPRIDTPGGCQKHLGFR